ncbi:MAG: hypothetical protein CVT94_16425 [Bacteroidetes bacterium HGW-Bacteroidetes-11]|nr:MAG: hypothetical protein CVT94_16425 [Bacteroidetes bacterium HGW-Bacteroidetes-11]
MFNLPIGYYTFLRIIISIGAVLVAVSEFKNQINAWVILFTITGILFNPILPVYFHDKSIWIPIDIIAGILFLIKSFNLKPKES